MREFFLGPEPTEGLVSDSALEDAVWRACLSRMESARHFTALEIADEVTAGLPRTVETVTTAIRTVHATFERGRFGSLGYARSAIRSPTGFEWVYHPDREAPDGLGTSAAARLPSIGPTSRSSPGRVPGLLRSPADRDPHALDAFLASTPAESRARALAVAPWRAAWMERTDVIPPASDEQTELIDRSLELRGLLSREELVEIHRTGDLWHRRIDAERIAAAVAKKNLEALLAEERLARQLARQKKKEEAAIARARRAEDAANRKRTDILHLGRGVSKGLADRRSHVEKLESLGLPVLSSPLDVARALGVEISTLRFLAYHAEAQRYAHYVQFEVPKRSGGVRTLAAPKPDLAAVQRWLLANVLEKVPVERAAHGFVKGRSIVTNARAHAGRSIVVNQDLVDFFPSITFPRVRGTFERLGYSPAVATIFALLTTECPRARVRFAGHEYHVAVGPRALPQGACTSPALSNLVAARLDRRLDGYASKHGWTYTRYADDLTFSADEEPRGAVGKLLATLHHIARSEGFAVHPDKGRVQRRNTRQLVTGIVVNESRKLGVPREEVRRIRAILHNAKKTGLSAQNRDLQPTFEAWLRGKIAYIAMVDPARGLALQKELESLEL